MVADDDREPGIESGPPVVDSPIEGQIVLLMGAKASLSPQRLPELLGRVQTDLGDRLDAYRREFECVDETPGRLVFLVPVDHWTEIGDRLGLGCREIDVVRRSHNEQLRRIGPRDDRREEFEIALEIRDAVVVGRSGPTEERQG